MGVGDGVDENNHTPQAFSDTGECRRNTVGVALARPRIGGLQKEKVAWTRIGCLLQELVAFYRNRWLGAEMGGVSRNQWLMQEPLACSRKSGRFGAGMSSPIDLRIDGRFHENTQLLAKPCSLPAAQVLLTAHFLRLRKPSFCGQPNNFQLAMHPDLLRGR